MFYFYLFILYSFCGWVNEIFVTTITDKKVVNRGFLIGPYCPIYGVAALVMLATLKKYQNDLLVLFVMAALTSTIIEYITSYLLEKLFHARWWDYTRLKFNINGRVCLGNSILFGIAGLLLVKYVNPVVVDIISSIPAIPFYVIGCIVLVLFIIDMITSFSIISKLSLTINDIRRDHTDFISEKVKTVLMEKSRLSRRVFRAFPNLNNLNNYITKKGRKK